MSRTGWAYEQELRTGLRILLIVGVLGGGWFALVPLAGAVVVPGNLVVQSNVKTIQHPTGGVVAEIRVHNGIHVGAGDLLVRLDATQLQANLQMVNKQLDGFRARMARLVAERDEMDRFETPPELADRTNENNVASLLASENSLFRARFTARKSQKDLLQSRVAQLSEEITGLDAQVASKAKQLDLISGELTGVQDLYDKRLVPLARLTTLQREAARIEGERGQLISAIAETKSKIGEAQLQIIRIDQDFRTEVVKELGETQGKEAELVERGVAAKDQLDRIELRAPTSGLIHQLSVHTIGGVIRAGDSIMELVPDSDELLVETRLQPSDIDQVRLGQKAFVRFSAFNQRTTPSARRNGVVRVGNDQPRPGDPSRPRRSAGRRTRVVFLGKGRARRRRAPPVGRPSARPGHACGSFHAHRQTDHDELSAKADHRTNATRICRTIESRAASFVGVRGPQRFWRPTDLAPVVRVQLMRLYAEQIDGFVAGYQQCSTVMVG